MNSKFTNQDLINATLEIYGDTYKQKNNQVKIKSSNQRSLNKKKEPLILTKEIQIPEKNHIKIPNKYKSLSNKKINNAKRLRAYRKKKKVLNRSTTLRLNKIIKFEDQDYLLLRRIKNSDLRIIRMKRSN